VCTVGDMETFYQCMIQRTIIREGFDDSTGGCVCDGMGVEGWVDADQPNWVEEVMGQVVEEACTACGAR